MPHEAHPLSREVDERASVSPCRGLLPGFEHQHTAPTRLYGGLQHLVGRTWRVLAPRSRGQGNFQRVCSVFQAIPACLFGISGNSSVCVRHFRQFQNAGMLGNVNSVSGRHVSLISSEIEGLLTQESRPGQISAGRRCRIFDLDCSDWSNGLRYHNFDNRSDTEFKALSREFEEFSLTLGRFGPMKTVGNMPYS